MKHIKSFYENSKIDILSDVKSILYELTDEGMELTIENKDNEYVAHYQINLKGRLNSDMSYQYFIENVCERLIDVLKLHNSACRLSLCGNTIIDIESDEIGQGYISHLYKNPFRTEKIFDYSINQIMDIFYKDSDYEIDPEIEILIVI